MKRVLILFVALLMLIPAAAFADNGVNVEVKVGREIITVGDVIPLQVVVTHPQGWRVVFPQLETAWGDLEIRKQSAPVITQNADGTETTTLKIDAAAFRPGTAMTPELNLKIADAQGQVHELYAAPVSVEVQSVLTPEDQELRDIKPQAELWQLTSSPLPLIGSVLLASALVVGAGIFAWKKRPQPDKRTPRQRALDYLKALDAVALDERMNVKFLAVRVSDVLRDYLANGCRIPAHDLTTGELAHALATRGVPQDIALQIVRVLRVCDDVKFANDVSDMDAIRTLTLTARNIIANYPPPPEASSQRGSKKIIEVKP